MRLSNLFKATQIIRDGPRIWPNTVIIRTSAFPTFCFPDTPLTISKTLCDSGGLSGATVQMGHPFSILPVINCVEMHAAPKAAAAGPSQLARASGSFRCLLISGWRSGSDLLWSTPQFHAKMIQLQSPSALKRGFPLAHKDEARRGLEHVRKFHLIIYWREWALLSLWSRLVNHNIWEKEENASCVQSKFRL